MLLGCHVTGLPQVKIITPADPEERGAQLSVMFSVPVDKVFTELTKRGVAVRHDVLSQQEHVIKHVMKMLRDTSILHVWKTRKHAIKENVYNTLLSDFDFT